MRNLEKLGISYNSYKCILRWVKMYQEHCPESLMPKFRNSAYTKECKTKVAEEYLAGNGSLDNICIKSLIDYQYSCCLLIMSLTK